MIDQLKKLSKEMQEMYPGPPKEGDVRVYKLLGIRPKQQMVDPDSGKLLTPGRTGFTIPNHRGLPESYTITDPGDGGEVKTIEYVTRMRPNSEGPASKVLGEIAFTQEDAGMIRIHKENYNQLRNVDIFLFFAPWLNANADKPFFIKSPLGFLYYMESANEIAEDFIEKDDTILRAKNMIAEMDEDDKNVLIESLQLGNPKIMTMNEKLEALKRFSSNYHNARRMLTQLADKDVVMRKLIKLAIEQEIIEEAETEFVWVKGKTVICHKLPKKTLVDSLIVYFATEEGIDVLATLKKSVEGNMKKDAVKTPETEPVAKIPSDDGPAFLNDPVESEALTTDPTAEETETLPG